MAHNNLVCVKGDITADIYYDVILLRGKPIQYLRLYMMIDGVPGVRPVKGLRISAYGPLAELVYGHIRKGSRLYVAGHIQQRMAHDEHVFEIVAEDVEFIRNIDWINGERVREDLTLRGLLRPSTRGKYSVEKNAEDAPSPDEYPDSFSVEDILRDA